MCLQQALHNQLNPFWVILNVKFRQVELNFITLIYKSFYVLLQKVFPSNNIDDLFAKENAALHVLHLVGWD